MSESDIESRLDALVGQANRALDRGDAQLADDLLEAARRADPTHSSVRSLEARIAATDAAGGTAGPATDTRRFGRGRYLVTREIGSGTSKMVYLAHDTVLERDVAIGTARDAAEGESFRARLLREARISARLGADRRVVSVYDVDDDDGAAFIVLEHMAGGDLSAQVRAAPGGLPIARVVQLAGDMCRALQSLHERGIIHRDIKPSNIWLDADGRAKLGDLGIARLIEGTDGIDDTRTPIVGTPAYMPPEQALGRPAIAASDLYSLGAVLYELVTGSQPFRQGAAASVVAQHISMPPPNPRDSRSDCPPALADLIGELLEKDPADRPVSADAVLQRLEAIDPEQPMAEYEGPRLRDDAPFIGRLHELAELEQMLEGALRGRGAVVAIVGEPGQGKSRLAEEVMRLARARGADAFVGRAREGSGAPAYWPWIEIVNEFARERDVAHIVSRLPRSSVRELSRLFPEIDPTAQPDSLDNSEAARFRMFDAYASFVRVVTSERPAVMLIEDLQWADTTSAELLEHLAFELDHTAALLIVTVRGTELYPTHRATRTLAELNRSPRFTRMALEPLTAEDVRQYLRSALGQEPEPQTVVSVHAASDGNAFFLSEIVRLMLREQAAATDARTFSVPPAIADVLDRRIGQLGSDAADHLSTAALIGRSFTFDQLSLAGGQAEATLDTTIGQAVAAQIIEPADRPGQYRFRHALMQNHLEQRVLPRERAMRRGRIGHALERLWGDRAAARPSRLAEQFVEAAAVFPEYAPRAASYCVGAAVEAERTLAWAEAVQRYEQALDLGDASESLKDDADLQRSLGVAAMHALIPRTAWTSLSRAMDLYRRSGRATEAAETALLTASIPSARPLRLRPLNQALREVGEDGDPELAGLLIAQRLRITGLDEDADLDLQARLDSIVTNHATPRLEAAIAALAVERALHQSRLEDTIVLADEAFARFRALGDVEGAAAVLHARAVAAGQVGRLDQATALLADQERYAREHHMRRELGHALQGVAGVQLARCDYDGFRATLAEIPAEAFTRSGYEAALAEQSGDLERAVALLPDRASAAGVPGYQLMVNGLRARVLFNAGQQAEAREDLEIWKAAVSSATGTIPGGVTPIEAAVGLVDEALATLGDDDLVAQAYALVTERRADAQPRRTIESRGLDHARGQLALRLGRIDDAERHFRDGHEWAERERCPVWSGRCLLGLAITAAERNQPELASAHLDEALARFAAHDAQLYVREAVARKFSWTGVGDDSQSSIDLLLEPSVAPRVAQEGAPVVPPTGTVTLMFSDIEGATPLNERLGDRRWLELLHEHDRTITALAERHSGYVVKSVGDGFMIAFGSAANGVRCAVEMQRALRQAETEGSPIRVRIGLHTGEAAFSGGDYRGHNVNLAARVAAAANGHEILISTPLRALLGATGDFTLIERPPTELKGIADPQILHDVAWLDELTSAAP